jgi:hypothetical protein
MIALVTVIAGLDGLLNLLQIGLDSLFLELGLASSGPLGGCQVGVLGWAGVPELAPPAAVVGGIHRPAVELGIPINPCKIAIYRL